MTWQDEVEEIKRRRELAAQMGGEERVARQHAAGKLTIRERLEALLDPGSFREIGGLAGNAEYEGRRLASFKPSGYVLGLAQIDGRPVAVGGEDFTSHRVPSFRKNAFLDKLAAEYRVPLIQLIEGFGGGAEFRGPAQRRQSSGEPEPYSSFIPMLPDFHVLVRLMSTVPVVAANLGSVAGLPAARTPASHFLCMVRGTQIFPAGPPLVKRSLGLEISKDDLGGHLVHARGSGVADNEAADEQDCFRQIRQFLSYLPSNVWQLPPRGDTGDHPERRDEELLSIVPRARQRPYNIRRLLAHVFDRDSLFETNRYFGRGVVTFFGRLHGYPVGIMANDPMSQAGAMDGPTSDKMTRFVDLCDTFHLPIAYFMDNPGFMIGPTAEQQGTLRHGMRALFAIDQSTVPWITVVMRKIYGVAGSLQAPTSSLTLRYAWPSAEWGGIPVEGGVDAVFRQELAAVADPEARRREIEEMLNRARSPFRTAERFEIEEIIDPRDTRPLLCEWARLVQPRLETELVPKTRGMRP